MQKKLKSKAVGICLIMVFLITAGCSTFSLFSPDYSTTVKKPTLAEEIEELKELVDKGIISQQEYEKTKSQLLKDATIIEEEVEKQKGTMTKTSSKK